MKDPLLDPVARMLFMREPKVAKGEPAQQPICVLNIVLPEIITREELQKKLKGTSVRLFQGKAQSIPRIAYLLRIKYTTS